MWSAPAFAKSSMWRSGRSTIRCTSTSAPAVVDLLGERVDDERAHADRRHEVAVHDVDVDRARAGVEHGGDLLAEAGEVGGQDRRRDAARGHMGWSIDALQWLHA